MPLYLLLKELMATARPFAYNPGPQIPGTEQLGDLSIGYPTSGFTNSPQYWNGPDEELGYVIAIPVPDNSQPTPLSGVTASVGFYRSSALTESSFVIITNTAFGQNFTDGNQASTWLTNNGYWTSYIAVTPTPTSTLATTPTPTPSVTATLTPTVTTTPTTTPTNTPTPSSTSIPVTGYSFNLVATPYNFPSAGNSIMNGPGGATSGSTDINALAITSRGFYFNSFDNDGIDRTSYFSAFTGQSVTITFNQTGTTAIYSGDTNSFKQWIQSPQGSGFVFGTNIGVPPSGTPSGTAVLIQSASTLYNIGFPVYVSLVVN